MNRKLTLRMDDALIQQAKLAAGKRGKSVSRMVAEFFGTLGERSKAGKEYPPPHRQPAGRAAGQARG